MLIDQRAADGEPREHRGLAEVEQFDPAVTCSDGGTFDVDDDLQPHFQRRQRTLRHMGGQHDVRSRCDGVAHVDIDQHRRAAGHRAQLNGLAHRRQLHPPLRQHVQDVDVERAVQLRGRALGGETLQAIAHLRRDGLASDALAQHPLDVVAVDLDRRTQPDPLERCDLLIARTEAPVA